MIDFTPAPWPESISKHFTGFLRHLFPIKEVPAFLHETIEEFTVILATSKPDFLYEDIRINATGSVLVTIEDAKSYDMGFREAVEAMEQVLTGEYVRAAKAAKSSKTV
jgi:hypothetical protein